VVGTGASADDDDDAEQPDSAAATHRQTAEMTDSLAVIRCRRPIA
jgi:hypothetical protein